MKICAATGNPGKLRELRRILEAQGHQVLSQKELGLDLEPEETGVTFEENAAIKAAALCKASGLPTIADDSGLCVDALDGAPGVYSARYCGRHGDDEANNDKLLQEMAAVPEGQRTAQFVSAVCLMLPDGRSLLCAGTCRGRIAFQRLTGSTALATTPCSFRNSAAWARAAAVSIPRAELCAADPGEKDAISHRGRALEKLEAQLPDFLINPSTAAAKEQPPLQYEKQNKKEILYVDEQTACDPARQGKYHGPGVPGGQRGDR